MYVIEVLPIQKNIPKETLTYFSSSDVTVGDLVTVLIRKKNKLALVASVSHVASSKSDLKARSYTLQKIISAHGASIFPMTLIRTCEKVRRYFITSTGALLYAMVPTLFHESPLHNFPDGSPSQQKSTGLLPESSLLQNCFDERIEYYHARIRQELNKRSSVVFVAPTQFLAEKLYSRLSSTHEGLCFLLHGKLSKKKQLGAAAALRQQKNPCVQICTPQYVFLARSDTSTLVLEFEGQEQYHTIGSRPIDKRMVLEQFARENLWTFVRADTFVDTETLTKSKTHHYTELAPVSYRIPTKANIRSYTPYARDSKQEFQVFDQELLRVIEKTISDGANCIVYTTKSGLGSLTVCKDCQKPFACSTCARPLTLHNEQKRIFRCHSCLSDSVAIDQCQECTGSRIATLGIGSERTFEFLKKKFPKAPIILFDSTVSSSKKKLKELHDTFYTTPGAILVGTSLIFSHFEKPVTTTIVASIDAIAALPRYDTTLLMVRSITKVAALAEGEFIFQYRNIQKSHVRSILSGNVHEIFQQELRERKQLGFPPVTTLIKIATRTQPGTATRTAETYANIFSAYKVRVWISPKSSFSEVHVLIRIPAEQYEKATISGANDESMRRLLSLLYQMPKESRIEINPRSLL